MTNTPVKTSFHILAKPVGPACNLTCDYCFYLEKESLFPKDTTFKMEPDVLESFIRQYIESQPTNTVHFTWQGGEPTLLGVEYFQEIVQLQNKHSEGKQISNAIQTNGVLLDEIWGEFLHENHFLVGISIDGPQALHDQYRIGHHGDGTFEKVMLGLELLKKYKVEFNTLTVVNQSNQDEANAIYDFLKSIGSEYWQFIPAVERTRPDGSLAAPHEMHNLDMAEWSVDPESYGQFLNQIFQRWVREDVGTIYVQQFEAALANEMGRPAGVCVWNATCGQALAVEHNGDLYSCDHYVFPEYRLGNILEIPLLDLVHSSDQQNFGADKRDGLPQICNECEVLYLCHGECPKHRFAEGSNGEQRHNYLCNGYKQFFTSIQPELGVLKEILELGQPATNIVGWMHEKDQGFPNIDVELSDPCPCGSKAVFQECCLQNLSDNSLKY
ncbi:MAG: anaerobic sulfatase maturase [Candidatus Marinimicrobia bacterium]|nr:anaerobic sulfatase maturase [Candidatus Neomarinimicrobiota bacterium]